jgi:hypothetical protein
VREVAAAHALGPAEQLVNRSGDRPRERKAGRQSQELDDDEEPPDDEQREEQRLAEAAAAQSLRRRDPIVELADAELGGHHERAGCT